MPDIFAQVSLLHFRRICGSIHLRCWPGFLLLFSLHIHPARERPPLKQAPVTLSSLLLPLSRSATTASFSGEEKRGKGRHAVQLGPPRMGLVIHLFGCVKEAKGH